MLIGGIAAAVIVVAGLFYLLFASLQQQDTPEPVLSLSEYCQENPENCSTKGSADAPVKFIEVSDYGCGFCRDFNLNTAPLLEDLYVRTGVMQWIAVPYALGGQTTPAAEASMCAAEQDSFFEFHERMFEIQGESQALSAAGLSQVAEELGLDIDSFNSCFGERTYGTVVQENIRTASRAGVRSTPTFFINGTMIRGNVPLADFQQSINNALSVAQ
jgi:protein-disulfide isomerase